MRWMWFGAGDGVAKMKVMVGLITNKKSWKGSSCDGNGAVITIVEVTASSGYRHTYRQTQTNRQTT